MNQPIVLKGLQELGDYAELFVTHDQIPEARALVPVMVQDETLDLEAIAQGAERAARELRDLAAEDARSRAQALEALERYRRLQAQASRLESLVQELHHLVDEALALGERAFDPSCESRAQGIASDLDILLTAARQQMTAVMEEAAALTARDDLARLLAEERAREEAVRREVEARQRQARLREGIAQAEELARQQKFDEARRVLGALSKQAPNSPDLASSIQRVRRQEAAVKSGMAEAALRQARRRYRSEPQEALALLQPLDASDLPDVLTRQLYGCWLDTCRRLGLVQPVHYSPSFGKAAVLVPAPDGQLEVVSAIGLPHWMPGQRFATAALRGARPLH